MTVPASRSAGSLRAVEAFLVEREPWLRRHLDRQAAALAVVSARGALGEGAVLVYLGLPHTLRVLPASAATRRTTVSRVGADDGDELVVVPSIRDRRALRDVLVGWLRDRARVAIERAIERHAPALGVTATGITVRDQRTRWGSASRKGRLAFSWRLVMAPPEILESVVVHELAHLRVFGHGPAFWAIVATRCPDYLALRRWLRQHSVELHAALEDSSPPADRLAGPGTRAAID